MLARLDPIPAEILITADGCNDGTVAVVRRMLPNAKVFENPSAQGSVAARDRMMREATSDLVLALDDDSYPEEQDCITRIGRMFEHNSRLAVVSFPQRTDEYPQTLQQLRFGSERLVSSFANSGAVLRRSVYLQLPGFEPKFRHMYEEPDYALQCIAAGHQVLSSPIVTIRHHYSGRGRSERDNHHQHARNELWSVVLRCPLPYAVGVGMYRTVSQFRYACTRGISWVAREPLWWWAALKGLPMIVRRRKAVPWTAYRKWLSLARER